MTNLFIAFLQPACGHWEDQTPVTTAVMFFTETNSLQGTGKQPLIQVFSTLLRLPTRAAVWDEKVTVRKATALQAGSTLGSVMLCHEPEMILQVSASPLSAKRSANGLDLVCSC